MISAHAYGKSQVALSDEHVYVLSLHGEGHSSGDHKHDGEKKKKKDKKEKKHHDDGHHSSGATPYDRSIISQLPLFTDRKEDVRRTVDADVVCSFHLTLES
ncbi:hypothetical protein HA466_0092680 [Hirschfeldia incana]|nr:hypothetical protein HA466_0092680 [Hirschfeldia incana]